MKIKSTLLSTTTLLTTILQTLVTAQLALAEESHHAEHHVDASFTGLLTHLWPYYLNFFLYLGLMYLLLRKKIAAGWQSRQASIELAVNKGKIEMAAAAALLADVESKVKSIDADKSVVTKAIQRETEHELEAISADAARRAERIAQQSAEIARAEKLAGEKSARDEIANLALERAEKTLTASVDANVDRAIRGAAFNEIKSLMS